MNDKIITITDIRSCALDDGPGIRTTVFFKGCPLACAWCHNPETISPRPQISFSKEVCIGCNDCVTVCPAGAMADTETRIDRRRCRACGACAEQCPTGALEMTGRPYTVGQLLDRLLDDREFFTASGGGVTLSGGEATLFPGFAGELLRRLEDKNIHTLLQTCGHYNRKTFEREMLPYLDMIHYDLKLIDPAEHRKHTGRDNGPILENLAALLASGGPEVTVRTPLVPGITDTSKNLAGIRQWLAEHGGPEPVLLPYNPGGSAKRETLGKYFN